MRKRNCGLVRVPSRAEARSPGAQAAAGTVGGGAARARLRARVPLRRALLGQRLGAPAAAAHVRPGRRSARHRASCAAVRLLPRLRECHAGADRSRSDLGLLARGGIGLSDTGHLDKKYVEVVSLLDGRLYDLWR